MVVGKVTVLLIAVVKVITVLKDVDGKVDSTRVAFVIVAFTLEVVRIVTGHVEA